VLNLRSRILLRLFQMAPTWPTWPTNKAQRSRMPMAMRARGRGEEGLRFRRSKFHIPAPARLWTLERRGETGFLARASQAHQSPFVVTLIGWSLPHWVHFLRQTHWDVVVPRASRASSTRVSSGKTVQTPAPSVLEIRMPCEVVDECSLVGSRGSRGGLREEEVMPTHGQRSLVRRPHIDAEGVRGGVYLL